MSHRVCVFICCKVIFLENNFSTLQDSLTESTESTLSQKLSPKWCFLDCKFLCFFFPTWGWSGGAMVLGKLPVPGRPTILITVGQGPIALAVGAGGGCLDIFTLIYPFSPLSPSLWETARYRLKYCLKGPLKPRQPTKSYIQGCR